MENTGYIALSYQTALRRKMDTVANNLANVNTTGFQGQRMLFQEYVVKHRDHDDMSMVFDYGAYRQLEQGPMQPTGNTLDIALEGRGYLVVETAQGNRYSRNGSMHLNNIGELVNSDGLPVLNAGGARIVIPQGTQEILIDEGGQISTEAGQLGQIQVVSFENPQELNHVGGNLLEAPEGVAPPVPDPQTRVIQGSLEGSNVNSILEMTDMIEVHRAYERVSRVISNDHDLRRNAIGTFARWRGE